MQDDVFTVLDSEEAEKKKRKTTQACTFSLFSWGTKALGWSHRNLKWPFSCH